MSMFKLLNCLISTPKPKVSSLSRSSKLSPEDKQRWKDLLIESSGGDKQAYDTLLGEMYDYLNIFCRRHLYNPEQLEDCVQECLFAIHKAKHTFDHSKSIGPWFFTIVRHKIIDQFRKSKRQKEREKLDPHYEEVTAGPSYPDIDLAGELQKLLPKLSPLYREVFVLTKIENKSVKETAELLNVGESAVKVRAHRANKALRKLIETEFANRYL